MTHPLTPREKVAAVLDPEIWADDMPVPTRAAMTDFHARRKASVIKADAILAVLASSGDHAELARLAEWRDRLRADPGRAAHFGSPYADKPMQNGRTYWNSDLADDITSLIAEVAALREKVKFEIKLSVDNYVRATARATEAERRLAEALGLLRDTVEASGLYDAPGIGIAAKLNAIRTFLSKEAERG